jgi:pimeloyl-ACP methyl ester carboxylesterase
MLDIVDVPEPRTVHTATGRAVGYYEFGDPNGTPIIAMHGTPACGAGFAWADVRARARGIRLLAPDRPGVGDSDPWTAGHGSIVGDYPPELAAFVDALGIDTFSIMGYSGGGPYALAVAHAFPDRVTGAAIVAGSGQVGLWATMNDFDAIDRTLTRLADRAPILARASLSLSAWASRVAPKSSFRFLAYDLTPADRAVMAKFPTPRAGLAVFVQSCRHGARGVVDDYGALGRPWGFAVEDITVPIHCWHATEDHIVPMHHTDELIRRIPGAQLTQWEGEGHLALVDHVGEVLDALAGAT